MRKVVLFFIFFLTIGLGVNAQIRFGVKAGANLSGVSKDSSINNIEGNVGGLHLGVALEWMFTEHIGIEGSAIYSEKAIKFADGSKNKKSFLDLPLNVRYKLNVADQIKPFVDMGPYLSFKIASDKKANDLDMSGQWKGKCIEGGLNFGAGVELFNMLQLRAGYGMGLTTNFENTRDDLNVKNRTWSFAAAVFF